MNEKLSRWLRPEILLFFLLLFFLMPTSGCFQYDTECWITWATYIKTHGLGNIYHKPDANYPPLIMYFLYIYNCMQGSTEKIAENIHYFRVLPLLFDFLPIFLLIACKKKLELKKGYHFLLLFNIAYLYNTMLWGQVDSIHSNLILTALYIVLSMPYLSVIIFVMAMNMKLQSVVFVPIFLMCLLTQISSVKVFFKLLLTGISVQAALLLPFLIAGTLPQLYFVVINSASYYPQASMNAFNLWHLIIPGDPMNTNDVTNFFIISFWSLKFLISYKSFGLLLFMLFSALALFPLFFKIIRALIQKQINSNFQELLFLTSGMIALIFFYFNTEMHERYSHPALIFLFFYGMLKRNFLLYVLVSIAYFLNMERVLEFYSVPHFTLIFEYKFVASLFSLIILLGLISIYRNYKLKEDWRIIKEKLIGLFKTKNKIEKQVL